VSNSRPLNYITTLQKFRNSKVRDARAMIREIENRIKLYENERKLTYLMYEQKELK